MAKAKTSAAVIITAALWLLAHVAVVTSSRSARPTKEHWASFFAGTLEGSACETEVKTTCQPPTTRSGFPAAGLPGLPGPRGESGPPGVPGPMGVPGERGRPGVQGYPGERGPTGDMGERGPAGETGEHGMKGEKGEPGPVRLLGQSGGVQFVGEPGQKGEAGQPGPRGLKGERGETGRTGYDGRDGEKGAQGERGEGGIPGFPGLKGDPGMPGFGQKGEPGAPGLDRTCNVAFFVVWASGALPQQDDNSNILVFDQVFTNEGHAYDKTTGIFKVPFNGTFVIQMGADGNNEADVTIHLVKNGQPRISLRVVPGSSSKQVVGHLTAGTKLRVDFDGNLPEGTTYTFSAFCLTKDL